MQILIKPHIFSFFNNLLVPINYTIYLIKISLRIIFKKLFFFLLKKYKYKFINYLIR